MVFKCAYCGGEFTALDRKGRKYCPKCQRSGERYAKQFKERRKKEPLVDIYASYYSKLWNLYKQKRITKDALDDWRKQAKLKQHEVSTHEITLRDFKTWCEKTYWILY